MPGKPEIPKKLLFSIDTSHGYHELICGDINVVELGRVEVFGVEYKDEYSSKITAKFTFYWNIFKELISRLREAGRKAQFFKNDQFAKFKNLWFKPGPKA